MGGRRPFGLSEKLLVAIGTFVAAFSLLELETHILVWRLLVPKQQSLGRRVTRAVPFDAVIRMLGSLFEIRTRDGDLVKRMRALSERLNEARRVRNDALHAFWVDRPDTDNALVIRMQSRPEGFREDLLDALDIDGLYEWAEKFKELQREVTGLHAAVYRSSPALRDD